MYTKLPQPRRRAGWPPWTHTGLKVHPCIVLDQAVHGDAVQHEGFRAVRETDDVDDEADNDNFMGNFFDFQ